MKEQLEDFPFRIIISFQGVIDAYEKQLESEETEVSREYINKMLEYVSSFPQLKEGIEDPKKLRDLREPIKILLDDLFPSVLSNNEIKTASIPFHNIFFNRSARLKRIMEAAGEDFVLKMRKMDEEVYPGLCEYSKSLLRLQTGLFPTLILRYS